MATKKGKKKEVLTLEQKENIKRYVGLTVLVIAVFTFLSIVSYLFTWKTDSSLAASFDKSADVTNWCGHAGYLWSKFLVTKCFGLGSLFLVFLLGAVAYKYVLKKSEFGLLRVTFITVVGAFVASMFLAYVSDLVGAEKCFGGGLGGDAGSAVC